MSAPITFENSGTFLLPATSGQQEVIVDLPSVSPRAIAVVGHPQPLLGGNASHKIPRLLAQALRDAGWMVLRPNFRGVGASSGTYSEGIGESDDVLALCAQARQALPSLPLDLVGFSFGAFVMARAAHALAAQGAPARRTWLAGMPAGDVEGGRRYDTPTELPDAAVVHGEHDRQVPLSAVLDWARPHAHPVTVIPGADHFFTGKLHIVRSLMLSHLA